VCRLPVFDVRCEGQGDLRKLRHQCLPSVLFTFAVRLAALAPAGTAGCGADAGDYFDHSGSVCGPEPGGGLIPRNAGSGYRKPAPGAAGGCVARPARRGRGAAAPHRRAAPAGAADVMVGSRASPLDRGGEDVAIDTRGTVLSTVGRAAPRHLMKAACIRGSKAGGTDCAGAAAGSSGAAWPGGASRRRQRAVRSGARGTGSGSTRHLARGRMRS
jgi:hypothetical protein